MIFLQIHINTILFIYYCSVLHETLFFPLKETVNNYNQNKIILVMFTYPYLQLYRVKKNTGCTADDCDSLVADKPMTLSMHSESVIPLHSGNICNRSL